MLLIYSDISTPRTKYTFDLVFRDLLGIPFKVTGDLNELDQYNGASLNYSKSGSTKGIFIERTALLNSQAIEPIEIVPFIKNGETYLFPTANSPDIQFDIFAAVFYLVSRYEEYLPHEADQYGRFKASESIAAKHNFLMKPVVNQWVLELKALLLKNFPGLLIDNKRFSALLTYDIDVAYTFKGRGLTRCILSIFKDIAGLNFKRLTQRLKVSLGNSPDPSDVYNYLENTSKSHKLPAILFFLVGDRTEYDRNLHYRSKAMAKLLKKLAEIFHVGLHPSYFTSNDIHKLKIEKDRLESISFRPVTKSRQHFLRFTLPDTFLFLSKSGIKQDYSMGYADAPGFRAGICTPFYFYDLKNNKATELLLFPSAFMDGNFIKYLKSTPSQAIHMIDQLLQNVISVNGIFISIWHNDTLSDTDNYKGWKRVHDHMINQISSNSSYE